MSNSPLPLYGSASELLEKLALDSGFSISAPIDIEEVACLLGIQIEEFFPEKPEIVGQICFDAGKPKIRLNPHQNNYRPRRRFTLAHEIAHYALHSGSNACFVDTRKTMSRSEAYWDIHESEANAFAAQLLMPSPLILGEARGIIGKYRAQSGADKIPVAVFVNAMAEKFGVSTKAMEYRLKNLKIIK